MVAVENLVLVFIAGLITALATGLGALPFFVVDEVSDRWNVLLWGLASGIMLSASTFGLVNEGLANGTPVEVGVGGLAGAALVVVTGRILHRVDLGTTATPDDADAAADGSGTGPAASQGRVASRAGDPTGARGEGHGHAPDHADADAHGGDEAHDDGHDHTHGEDHDHGFEPEAFVEGDLTQLVLIMGILTVHSFPEGVAVGVSFAELGLEGGVPVLGVSIPVLAVFMTVAISIHNVPEGLAISIPLRDFGVSEWRMVGWAVFSSLPQPVGAVIAFGFVRWARAFMPYGFGFAAGAMVFLVVTELIPEGLESGANLDRSGYPEMAGGLLAGFAVMAPLLYV